MPHGMDDRIANCVLLEFLKTMFMGWYRDELETKCGTARACEKVTEEAVVPDPEITLTESRKSDVTRVFGWAIKELYSKWQSIRAQKKPKHMKDHEIAEEVVPFIAQMRYTHTQAIVDTEYMTNQYSTADQFRNRGGLTLVSTAYWDVGDKIVSKARLLVNEETLSKNGNASSKVAREKMMNDASLMKEFLSCDLNSCLAKEMRVAIFQKIVRKVLNAVTGHEYREYRSRHTGRLAKMSQNTTFRGGLKANSKKRSVKKKLQLDKSLAAASLMGNKLDATSIK
jgi:hypothetical protein